MKIYCLLLCLLMASFQSCKKDKVDFATGTVINQGGCYPDSWLVAIDNPNFSTHPFLTPAVLSSCIGCYNCSNAVFMSLGPDLGQPGTRIRFSYVRTEVSCLSFSEAANHITVKKLSRL